MEEIIAIIIFISVVLFSIPIGLSIIGSTIKDNHPKTAKVLFTIAIIYSTLVLAGVGICLGGI